MPGSQEAPKGTDLRLPDSLGHQRGTSDDVSFESHIPSLEFCPPLPAAQELGTTWLQTHAVKPHHFSEPFKKEALHLALWG